MTIEERVREDIINESDQLRTFWFEKIIPLLKKCKRKEGNLRGAIFDKETLKDFNDLNGLFREYRRRMRRMIAGMEEVNEFKKEVDPEEAKKSATSWTKPPCNLLESPPRNPQCFFCHFKNF